MEMNQVEILEYIKDEMEFAHDLWQDLNIESRTESFRSYLKTQITSTIFAQQADSDTMKAALIYFESLPFDMDKAAA